MNTSQVTGEQVRQAMHDGGISVVAHHDCGICGEWTSYHEYDGRLFYSSGCGCSWSPPRECDWGDVAGWINMQTDPKHRDEIAARFGIRADSQGGEKA